VAIQKKYGVKIDPEDPNIREHFRCVRNLARFVGDQSGR
jgi:acyl carrier protein